MRGDETRVVDTFYEHLDSDGWVVEREVDVVDVRATPGAGYRDGQGWE